MTRSILVFGMLALGAVAGAAQTFQPLANDPWCQETSHNDRPTWCEVREATQPAAPGALAVDATPNGGVKATGSDRTDVRVRVRVEATADTEAEARDMVSQVKIVTGTSLRAEGPSPHGHAYWSASFDLSVPRHSDVKFTSLNGPVAVADVEGHLELSTTNGPLGVTRASGSVHGRTQNGPLNVLLSGHTWTGAGLDVETVNGPVSLTVPADYNAQLQTGTTNGPVHLGFPLLVEGSFKEDINAKLGTGGPTIHVRTTNGPLNVIRQ